jgi:hypothetical protein
VRLQAPDAVHRQPVLREAWREQVPEHRLRDGWMRHLVGLADAGQMDVVVTALPMHGRSQVIIGRPLTTG